VQKYTEDPVSQRIGGVIVAHDTKEANRILSSQEPIFTEYTEFGPTNQPTQKNVAMFCMTQDADSAGTLHWGQNNDDHSSHYLSLNDIECIALGKQTAVLQWVAKDVDSTLCASITTRAMQHPYSQKRTLNFSANTQEQRNAWVFALCRRLGAYGKELHMDERTVEDLVRIKFYVRDAPVDVDDSSATEEKEIKQPLSIKQEEVKKPEVKAVQAVQADQVQAVQADPVQAVQADQVQAVPAGSQDILQSGRQFDAFFPHTDQKGTTTPIVCFSDEDALFWCTPLKRQKIPHCQIPLEDIRYIYLGKQTHNFQCAAGEGVPNNHAFSIIGKDNSLHLASQDEVTIRDFVDGLRDHLGSISRNLVQETPSKLTVQGAGLTGQVANIQPNNKMQMLAESTSALLERHPGLLNRMMRRGREFLCHVPPDANDPSGYTSRQRLVYKDHAVCDRGALYWTDVDSSELSDDQCKTFDEITSVKLGKTAQVQSMLENVSPDKCFAISCNDGIVLNFEGDSMEHVLAWTIGVKSIMNPAQDRITQ
jgi:hypothetical protein